MSRKPSTVRGPELKARMTYTAGLSNIQEAGAPPPTGMMLRNARCISASLTLCIGGSVLCENSCLKML